MARHFLECQHCTARYDVTHREPGARVRCRSCKNILVIPGRSAKPHPEQPALLAEENADAKGPIAELSAARMVHALVRPYGSESRSATGILRAFGTIVGRAWLRLLSLAFVLTAVFLACAALLFSQALLNHALHVEGSLVRLDATTPVTATLDRGTDQNVELGQMLEVRRDDRVIARLMVSRVADAEAEAQLVETSGALHVGDPFAINAVSSFGQSLFRSGVAIAQMMCFALLFAAGLRIGHRSLSDQGGPIPGLLAELKGALRASPKVLSVDFVFWLFAMGGLVMSLAALQSLPSLLAVPLTLAVLALLALAYAYLMLTSIVWVVEARPFAFALRRAAMLLSAAPRPSLLAYGLFTIMTTLPCLLLYLLLLVGFGILIGPVFTPDLASQVLVFTSQTLLGLFVVALHHELTREEGREDAEQA